MSDLRVRHALFEMTRSHLLELVRERGVLFWVFRFPILLAPAREPRGGELRRSLAPGRRETDPARGRIRLDDFLMMPMWLLSGSLFSYERYPEILHPFLRLLPLTALNDALRAITNECASMRQLRARPALVPLAMSRIGGSSITSPAHTSPRVLPW